MEHNKEDPRMEKARIDYGFYTKKAKELLCKLQDQNRHLIRTLDEFSDAMQRCTKQKEYLKANS